MKKLAECIKEEKDTISNSLIKHHNKMHKFHSEKADEAEESNTVRKDLALDHRSAADAHERASEQHWQIKHNTEHFGVNWNKDDHEFHKKLGEGMSQRADKKSEALGVE